MRAWLSGLRPDFRPSHYALSATRIAFFSVCLLELCQLYWWRRLCFSEHQVIPILGEPVSVPDVILPIAIAVQVSLILGFCTRTSALINFLALNVVAWTNDVHYHFDAVMANVAFIFLFMPSPRAWSVDAWLRRENSGMAGHLPVPLSRAYLLFLAVELVYFDSLLFKFQSTVWLEGLAFWMPAALPHFSTGMLPDWAEHPALMKGACYVALLTEALFPLVLFHRFRQIMFVFAFGLHLGIAVFFPIPLFGLGMCALLLLFVNWDAIQRRLKPAHLPSTTSTVSRPDPQWDAVGVAVATMMLCSQLLLIIQPPLLDRLPSLRSFTNGNQIIAKLMGVSRHGVYVDEHFAMETPILRWQTKIDGDVVELPTYDEQGYPRYPAVSGRFWVLHVWVLRRDCITIDELQSRWAWYVRRWFAHRGLEPRPVELYWKRVSSPPVADYDLDDRIEQQPWLRGGWMLVNNDGAQVPFTACLDRAFVAYLQRAMCCRRGPSGS